MPPMPLPMIDPGALGRPATVLREPASLVGLLRRGDGVLRERSSRLASLRSMYCSGSKPLHLAREADVEVGRIEPLNRGGARTALRAGPARFGGTSLPRRAKRTHAGDDDPTLQATCPIFWCR